MAFLILGVFSGFLMLFIGLCFIVWAGREHHIANKYRAMEVPAVVSIPVAVTAARSDQWILTYKDKKGKPTTMNLVGKDESEMLRNAVKAGVSFDKIISSRRA